MDYEYKLSICIPTYNRAKHLENCLESIVSLRSDNKALLEVCVSDNGSTDETMEVVNRMQGKMAIKYNRNPVNLGIPQNFINVVGMASGDIGL